MLFDRIKIEVNNKRTRINIIEETKRLKPCMQRNTQKPNLTNECFSKTSVMKVPIVTISLILVHSLNFHLIVTTLDDSFMRYTNMKQQQ